MIRKIFRFTVVAAIVAVVVFTVLSRRDYRTMVGAFAKPDSVEMPVADTLPAPVADSVAVGH